MTWRRLLDRLGATGKVRFARLRAAFWTLLGLASVPLGWANSVALVWAASVYANVASEVAAAEAADDHVVLDRLALIEQQQREDAERARRIEAKLDQLLAGVDERKRDDAKHPATEETEGDQGNQAVRIE